MLRHCAVHRGLVLEGDAVLLRMTETGSGPGLPVYACHECVRAQGLVPQRQPATFVGHRDTAPAVVGAA